MFLPPNIMFSLIKTVVSPDALGFASATKKLEPGFCALTVTSHTPVVCLIFVLLLNPPYHLVIITWGLAFIADDFII